MTDTLHVSKSAGIAEIVINHESKRNAMTLSMWEALPDVLEDVEQDDRVRVVLVRGQGVHFSAGADISEFETRRGDPRSARLYNETVERAERTLTGLTKPTVAVIRGSCIGGGCELALACDLRLADPTARMGITPAKLGVVYSFESTRQLVNVVGAPYAKYLLISGNVVSADEALRSGLIDQLHPEADLAQAATHFAQTVSSRSFVSVQGAKRMIDKIVNGADAPDDEARQLPIDAVESADYREGVKAFLDKRAPTFAGPASKDTFTTAPNASRN